MPIIGGECDGKVSLWILGKNCRNQIVTTINLGALMFNGIVSNTFCEIQSKGEYNTDWCQIRVNTNSWEFSEYEGVGLITKGPM